MISVVIPTHNRADTLKVCLQKLMTQEGVNFEVIVVDDGSTDHTEAVVKEFLAVRYFKQPASQQGVARNRGVKEAKGDVVLFMGDDIFAGAGFLKRHADRHAELEDEAVAVLGFSTWDPSLPVNSYMLFLEKSGWQFGYGFLKPGWVTRADRWKFFYTSNLSLKRSLLLKEGFDESFKGYGWEDIELGYRLVQRHGLKLFYEPEARATHYHLIPESALANKMQAIGRSAVRFSRLHPEAGVVPGALKRWAMRVLSLDLLMPLWKHLGQDRVYAARCRREFLAGVAEAEREG